MGNDLLRVLFLCSEYTQPTQPLGGVFFRDQARALRRAGVHVDVVFVEPRSLRTLSLTALRHQRFQTTSKVEDGVLTFRQHGWNPGLPRPLAGRIYASLTVHLANRYLRDHPRPHIIHAHCALWVGPAAARLKELHGIPMVLTEHHSAVLSLQDHATEAALRRSYSTADALFAVSRSLADAMAPRVPGRSIGILPNMVDTDFFVPSEGGGKRHPGTRVVAIGALDENKSHDILIRACAKARRHLPHIVLRIAGNGPRRAELVRLAKELQVDDAVHFEGALGRKGIRRLLYDSDLLVQPSKRETFGVTLIEAAAVGLPVIATRCGGPTEIVTTNTGILVPVDNDVELADAIIAAFHHPWNSAAIRKDCVARFGVDGATQRLKKIYAQVRARHNQY